MTVESTVFCRKGQSIWQVVDATLRRMALDVYVSPGDPLVPFFDFGGAGQNLNLPVWGLSHPFRGCLNFSAWPSGDFFPEFEFSTAC